MDKLYTISEVAKIFKCSTKTIRNWIKGGKLNAIRIGNGTIRISESEIERLCKGVNNNEVDA